MDPQAQNSFIPKKSLAAETRGSSFGLVFLIALLIFIASLVAAGAVFSYQKYLNAALDSKKASLSRSEGAYDFSAIQDLVRIDARLTQAKTLLAKHIAPSAIFGFLATQTLQTVQFTSFDYSISDEGVPKIAMSGTANSFSSVALQSDQFSASKILKDIVFSNIVVDPLGKITFSVNASVDPSLILYAKNITQMTTNTTTPPPSTPDQTSTTTPTQ